MAARKTSKTSKKTTTNKKSTIPTKQKKSQSTSLLQNVEDSCQSTIDSDPYLDNKTKQKNSKLTKITKTSKQKAEKPLKNVKGDAIIPIRLTNEVAHLALTKKATKPVVQQKKVADKNSKMNKCVPSSILSMKDIAELSALIEANILTETAKKTTTKKTAAPNETVTKALKGVVKPKKKKPKPKIPKKALNKRTDTGSNVPITRSTTKDIKIKKETESEEESVIKGTINVPVDTKYSNSDKPEIASPASELSETRLWTKVMCSNCKSLSPAEATDNVKINGKVPLVYISKNNILNQNNSQEEDVKEIQNKNMSILQQDLTISSSSSSSSNCLSSSSSSSCSSSDSDEEYLKTEQCYKQSSLSICSESRNSDSGKESSKINDRQSDLIELEWLDSVCDRNTNMDMFIQSIADNLQEEIGILELCRSTRLAAESFLDNNNSHVMPDLINEDLHFNNDAMDECSVSSAILMSSRSISNMKSVENKHESDDGDCLSLYDDGFEGYSLLNETSGLENKSPKDIMKRSIFEKQVVKPTFIEKGLTTHFKDVPQSASTIRPHHHRLPTLDSDCISLTKSKLYVGCCIFNIIGNCKYTHQCRYHHTTPSRTIMMSKLSMLSNFEFLQEYILARSLFTLRKLYMSVFIEGCICRNMWELLMEMAIDNYRFALENRTELLESILLGFTHTRICEVSLLDYKLTNNYLVCDLFINIISSSKNFSQFKGVFIELTEFYMKIKRSYNLRDAVFILERLSVIPCHKPLAEAMINVIFNSDVTILNNSYIERFENSIKMFPVLYERLRQYRDEKSRLPLQVTNKYSTIADTIHFNNERFGNQGADLVFKYPSFRRK